MAKTPTYNYSNYSLEELYRVTQDIDRSANPEAYAAAVREIVRKQKIRDSNQHRPGSSGGSSDEELHRSPAGMIGALIGAGGSIIWMNLYPRTTPLYGLNIDPLFAQIGMIVIGICFGALCGTCAGILKSERDGR